MGSEGKSQCGFTTKVANRFRPTAGLIYLLALLNSRNSKSATCNVFKTQLINATFRPFAFSYDVICSIRSRRISFFSPELLRLTVDLLS